MGFFKRFLGDRSDERTEAERVGMSVEEVVREAPTFQRYSDVVEEMTPAECVRYAVPRLSGASGSTWRLLQRGNTEFRSLQRGETELPNGYLLESDGPVSAALLDQLRKTAEEFDEEFWEFEGTREEVAVFWTEYGGVEMVQRLNTLLRQLARH
jgi:hypothetical protein